MADQSRVRFGGDDLANASMPEMDRRIEKRFA
jgi:hypothetical protein